MPYVLDTNIIRALLDGDTRVVSRVVQNGPAAIFVSIISFEEMTRGQNATLNRQLMQSQLIRAYADLSRTLVYFATAQVLPYDTAAALVDDQLRAQRQPRATKDRRIAAIALAHGYVLATRNTVDFQGVLGLQIEDWMAP